MTQAGGNKAVMIASDIASPCSRTTCDDTNYPPPHSRKAVWTAFKQAPEARMLVKRMTKLKNADYLQNTAERGHIDFFILISTSSNPAKHYK